MLSPPHFEARNRERLSRWFGLHPTTSGESMFLSQLLVLIPQCLLGWIGDDANVIAEVPRDFVSRKRKIAV